MRKSSKHLTLPIFDTDKVDATVFLGDNYLQVSEYRPMGEMFPEYFRVDRYVVEVLTQGEIHCSINLHELHVKAPCVIALLPDSVLHIDYASEDCKLLIIALNAQFADDLQMPDWSYRIVHAIRSHPWGELTEAQMKIVVQHFRLLQSILNEQDTNPHTRECALKLSHSLSLYLQGCFASTFEHPSLAHGKKQTAANFIRLAEQHCKKHKHIAWYAEQLCIAPKYLANVIRETTGKPAGEWIDGYVLLQAKTLLSTSRQSIQQIADQLGFKNQSHFGTFFRRHTGMSPRGFRNMG